MEETDEVYREGLKAFSTGDYKTAKSHFEQAKSMGHPNAHKALIHTHAAMNGIDIAKFVYNRPKKEEK